MITRKIDVKTLNKLLSIDQEEVLLSLFFQKYNF